MSKIKTLLGLACLTTAVNTVLADVQLPKIFSDNMVLQRDTHLPIWGTASPGEVVTVTLDQQTVKTEANKKGKWKIKLAPVKLGDPRTLTITGNNKIVLKNVLIGDVWLCSGQSNMEMGVKASNNSAEEIANANYPNIRLFVVPRAMSKTPQDNFIKKPAKWAECSSKSIKEGTWGSFSAAAYYFARKVYKETQIPIGLIQSSWGGTKIEPWTPPEGFSAVPELKDIADKLDDRKNTQLAIVQVEKWLKQAKAALKNNTKLPAPINAPKTIEKYYRPPTALYNSMIHPLVPFAIKGILWYQGESNRLDKELYYYKMKALITGWREVWKKPNMPFYYVQIAPFKYNSKGDKKGYALPALCQAQTKALDIPHTGMAIINDIGNLKNIHPKNKQEVGRRLALLALSRTYKQNVGVDSGPIFDSMKIDGNQVIISFKFVGKGLKTRDNEAPNWFEVAGEDGKFVKADASINGNQVVVSAKSVKNPTAVRFAWHQTALPNLTNQKGLPASCFSTEKKK